jgi:hypothetical protein
MQVVTDDNEQAFLDACEAVGVEHGEMLDTLRGCLKSLKPVPVG